MWHNVVRPSPSFYFSGDIFSWLFITYFVELRRPSACKLGSTRANANQTIFIQLRASLSSMFCFSGVVFGLFFWSGDNSRRVRQDEDVRVQR